LAFKTNGKICLLSIFALFSIANTSRQICFWHGNGYDKDMFGVGRIDLLRCYCFIAAAPAEQIWDLLLPIHTQHTAVSKQVTCCCGKI